MVGPLTYWLPEMLRCVGISFLFEIGEKEGFEFLEGVGVDIRGPHMLKNHFIFFLKGGQVTCWRLQLTLNMCRADDDEEIRDALFICKAAGARPMLEIYRGPALFKCEEVVKAFVCDL